MMRTCFVGQPDQQILDAIKTVQEAVDASIDMIKPGMRLGEVDAVSRKIISRARSTEFWRHASHAIGLFDRERIRSGLG